MIIYCAQCQIPLTKQLADDLFEQVRFGASVSMRKGHARNINDSGVPVIDGLIGVDLDDTINASVRFHEKRNGCCGHISDLVCKNGHVVGTNVFDCWADMNGFNPHAIRMY